MWLIVFALGRIDDVLAPTPPVLLAIEFLRALAPVCAPLALSRRPRGREEVFPV